jgi:formiminotetrahydrofolate cyclodeaminase
MAIAAVKGAMLNVRINLPGLENETRRKELESESYSLLTKSQELSNQIDKIVDSKLL